MTARGRAVEAAKVEDEIERINECRMPRWHVFASSSGKDFYATRMGKVRPALMEHEGYARTVHAEKLAKLEALMDEQDDIGWLRLPWSWPDGLVSYPEAGQGTSSEPFPSRYASRNCQLDLRKHLVGFIPGNTDVIVPGQPQIQPDQV